MIFTMLIIILIIYDGIVRLEVGSGESDGHIGAN